MYTLNFFKVRFLCSFLGLFFLALGCQDPCRELAHQMCLCYPKNDQAGCLEKVKLLSQHPQLNESKQDQQCLMYLKDPNCTCENLLKGQFETCGLSGF